MSELGPTFPLGRWLRAAGGFGLLATVLAAAPSPAAAELGRLFSIGRNGDLLRIVYAPAAGTVDNSIHITLPVETVSGGNGLARHPQTGVLYALVRTSAGFPTDRKLVSIDPTTGAATTVGLTGDRFAGLAFDASGTLYGVTGDGAATPATLYTLSLVDATPSFVMSLGTGDAGEDGEAIAFHPGDGLLYHASGLDDGLNPDTRIFEKIDVGTQTITNIPISGDGYSELTSLMFDGSGFLATDTLGPLLLRVTTGGVFSVVGTLDHVSKGLSPAPPAPVPLLGPAALVLLAGSLLALGAAVLRRRLGRA